MKIASSRPKRLEISKLIPTHNRLRDISRLRSVKNNDFAPPSISLIEDKYYVHDGHHRLVCMLARGEKFITEYKLSKFLYTDYNDINFERGYVTPLDLRAECRLPEFYNFKKVIMDMYYSRRYTKGYIEGLICKSRAYYCEKRQISSIAEMYVNCEFAL